MHVCTCAYQRKFDVKLFILFLTTVCPTAYRGGLIVSARIQHRVGFLKSPGMDRQPKRRRVADGQLVQRLSALTNVSGKALSAVIATLRDSGVDVDSAGSRHKIAEETLSRLLLRSQSCRRHPGLADAAPPLPTVRTGMVAIVTQGLTRLV